LSIIVGIDSTPAGQASLAAAIEATKPMKKELFIVPMAREGMKLDPASTAELLEVAKLQASAAGVQASVLATTAEKDLVDEFLKLAQDVDASLIVIAMRQRFEVGRFILSNNALRILLQADRPVLAVKSSQPPMQSGDEALQDLKQIRAR
jgi:nucleotide-binding universal stress UspA family protein